MSTIEWTFEDWKKYYYKEAKRRGDNDERAAMYAELQAHLQTKWR